ncbi:hypothetical protein SAMN05421858_4370 [Haladaptatus litoreus]|uniref:Uncharacterized protein n=1 Tax=Haladaptatus litoreus TaxID=553468 RepID=A0A1N7ELH0_9EURY|nr:hypothetical protein SAMN05421858_4370 [Haladaptatus litoreus]
MTRQVTVSDITGQRTLTESANAATDNRRIIFVIE